VAGNVLACEILQSARPQNPRVIFDADLILGAALPNEGSL
jgi:hypothetical protein